MNKNIHYRKAIGKINQNQFEAAVELLTRAIDDDSTNPFFYNQRAVCYLNLEKFELSLFDMNRSIELDNTYAYFYSSRGFLRARMRDSSGAMADYERSLELDPENEITYNNLGSVLEQLGHMNRAQHMYKKGNDILGYDPESRELEMEGRHFVKKGEIIPKAELAESIINQEEARKERKKLAKAVFSKKSSFIEFLGFIGNGFKLKDNDEG